MHGYSLLAAVIIDQALGEFSFAHPLVAFGNAAKFVESKLFDSNAPSTVLGKNFQGAMAVSILIVPPVTAAWAVSHLFSIYSSNFSWMFEAVVLYFAIGARSLREHANRVASALAASDLAAARNAVGMIVSRDTSQLSSSDVAKATIESVLENGNDAIFAAIFWTLVFGAPGAVLLRTSNTLDAMWGYRNDRYRDLGWAAARLDDCLNFVPARLTALTYALCGSFAAAVSCCITQGKKWYSPNAGPVMSAGAGALEILLGGNAVYDGAPKARPVLGCNNVAQVDDIYRANNLVSRSMVLWVVLALIWQFLTGG